jgi:phospholipid/cholesterol/gamma-HCH transport system substrate-binding protein
MTNFRAGVIAIVVVGLAAFFGFTKTNPFADPYEFKAVFNDVNNLKPKSPVRIAGVEVGKVKKVEAVEEGDGAARVTIEMEDAGLPIKEDAELKIRPRIFLEGNFFIDLEPGTPSAGELDEGGTIPVTQTAAPVQIGDVLTALQRDTRSDLQTFLREYSKALADGGAEGFNESIRWWEPAYRNAALANDATLGEDRDRDFQRVLSGQQQTFAALARDEAALKDLITNFNGTAGALAREDAALAASIPALRDTLRVGYPALGALNTALPSLRAFARDALPGVRSSDETLAAGTWPPPDPR